MSDHVEWRDPQMFPPEWGYATDPAPADDAGLVDLVVEVAVGEPLPAADFEQLLAAVLDLEADEP